MRPLLTTLAVVVVVVMGGSGALTAASFLVQDESRTEVAFDGIDTIVLDLGAGGIEVGAASGNGDGTVTGTRTDHSGLRRPRITERVEGSTLHLESDCTWFAGSFCGVDYELTVPAGVAIRGGSGGGGIDLAGIRGDVEVSASGGGITAVDTGGRLVLSSSGGGITLERPVGPLDLSSSGGGVTVRESRSDRVVARSSGGGVHLEFGRAPVDVDADSSGGGVTVIVPDDTASYAVEASSSGGDTVIEVDDVRSSDRRIRATSSGGGVTVTHP